MPITTAQALFAIDFLDLISSSSMRDLIVGSHICTGNLRLARKVAPKGGVKGERENELLFIIAAQSTLAPYAKAARRRSFLGGGIG